MAACRLFIFSFKGGKMKKCLFIGAALLLAIVASELFLRLTTSFELHYGTWFSRGTHRMNPRYGLEYAPNASSVMSHPDGVYNVPLHLDKYGFRLPQSSSSEKTRSVVLLGGASMVFSYGLADADTLHAQVAHNAITPLTVYNTAWPGFDPFYNYLIYRDTLAREISPDLMILCVYNGHDEQFSTSENWDNHSPPFNEASASELFLVFPDLNVNPPYIVKRLSWSKVYYSFYILAGPVNLFNAVIQFNEMAFMAVNRLTTLFIKPAEAQSTIPVKAQSTTSEETPAIGNFHAFVTRLRHELLKTDTKLLVVFLPTRNERDKNRYDTFMRSVPKGVPSIDLNNRYSEQFTGERLYIGDGHYNRKAVQLLGRAIAMETQKVILSDSFD